MMDWQTVFTVVIVGVLFFVMMRGCGGMMRGGCCGMKSHRRSDGADEDKSRPSNEPGQSGM